MRQTDSGHRVSEGTRLETAIRFPICSDIRNFISKFCVQGNDDLHKILRISKIFAEAVIYVYLVWGHA